MANIRMRRHNGFELSCVERPGMCSLRPFVWVKGKNSWSTATYVVFRARMDADR